MIKNENKFFISTKTEIFKNDQQRNSLLLRLPKPVLTKIFTFLDSNRDFLNSRLVCKSFYSLFQTDLLTCKFLLPILSPSEIQRRLKMEERKDSIHDKKLTFWGYGAFEMCDEILHFKKTIQDQKVAERKK